MEYIFLSFATNFKPQASFSYHILPKFLYVMKEDSDSDVCDLVALEIFPPYDEFGEIEENTAIYTTTFWISSKDYSASYEYWTKFHADLYGITGFAIQGPVFDSHEVVVGYAEGSLVNLKAFCEQITNLMENPLIGWTNVNKFATLSCPRYTTFQCLLGCVRTQSTINVVCCK